MAIKVERKKASNRPNVVVYGAPMSGKTTWVNSQVDREKTLFISTDGNALEGCFVVEVGNWADLKEAVNYAVLNDTLTTIVLDVLDDAVAFAEKRAQTKLGMSGKADAKGSYGKFTNTVGELVKEEALRPLLMSNKQLYTIMHSSADKEGVEVPSFGSYSSDAMNILNWLKGRSSKVVLCTNYGGTHDVIVEAERTVIEEKPASVKGKTKEAE